MAFHLLGRIRGIYIALHQDVVSAPTQISVYTGDRDPILWQPSSYPLCNIPDHHPVSVPHIHIDSASRTTALHDHDNTPSIPSSLASSPDMPPSFARAPLHIDETFTDAPPLDNVKSVPVSLRPIDRTTNRIPATSPDLVATFATHGSIDTSVGTPGPSVTPRAPVPKASTLDRKSTRLNSSHAIPSRMPSSA